MKSLPPINPKSETGKIVDFLKSVQKKTGINKVVIGISGGVDSATTHKLLQKAYKPENIFALSLPYEKIKSIVNKFEQLIFKEDSVQNFLSREKNTLPNLDRVRLGNIMARVRMIILFDTAKRENALVCGTENKSERLLGYFTRFGDAASDIEPISHLYKTHVYQLAKYLKVENKTIEAAPTAGLWAGQTDEGEFGFTYEEADQVLYRLFDKKVPTTSVILSEAKNLKKMGLKNADKIIERVLKNRFKLEVPYHL